MLDRDGTINVDSGFVHKVEDLRLLPHAIEGLRRMAAAGYRLIIASNQSGVARGLFDEQAVQAFNAALVELLGRQGVMIDAVYYCPDHPDATVAAYRKASAWRKPAPGMLLQAAADQGFDLAASIAIGDKRSDIAAGKAAGCRTILVRTGAGGNEPGAPQVEPDFTADDLKDAAEIVERLAAE